MGNRASNSSTATKGFNRETLSLSTPQDLNKENFTKYGNLTKYGNEGDFISFKDDPRDWNPTDMTPSKIFEFAKTPPSAPPPTENSMAFTSSSSSAPSTRQILKRNSPCSPDQPIPKIDWDRVMTPFSFPRSRATTTTSGSCYTHNNQGGEGVIRSKVPKINLELLSSGIAEVATKNFHKSSDSSVEPRENNNNNSNNNNGGNEKGDAISQPMTTTSRASPISLLVKASGSSSPSNGSRGERGIIPHQKSIRIPPAWLPDIRTSAARTNLRKKSPKSSILPFRFGKFGKRKSPSSLSKLKYTLKSSKSSKINFKSKSLTNRKSLGKLQKQSSQHLPSMSNVTTPASTAIRIKNPKNDPNYNHKNETTTSSSLYLVQELLVKNVGKPSKGSVNNRKKTISPPDDDEIITESYDETYSYSYETDDRGSGKSESPPKKVEKNKGGGGKRKGDPSSSGSEPTDAGPRTTSGTGTTSASTSDKSSKSKSEGYSGSKSQSGYKKSSSYYTAGGGESGETSSSRINNRRPKKKIPPPPVFIGSTGCCGGKKKNETPADRLKNVDIVEELIYNCPGDDDDGCEDSCCCCNLDYYACCNECGEIELVPQCTCTQKKKPKNPVRYCRRQHFNFDDGKKGDDDCGDGPPFCWEDRPVNPYDEIPVGKNPVIGKDNGARRGGCCGGDNNSTTTTTTTSRHHGRSCVPEDIDRVMPAESGTYFFDAERRCFVPVVEIQEPPPPPSPEVVDEIIDEEPVLTNVEPIIQPVIQPMGGCCCPNGGGCPMPFFGPMTCAGMGCCNNPCEGDKGSKKHDKDNSTSSGSGYSSNKGTDDSSSNRQMDNLGMMGLCGMNMNGLSNMGPYGTMAMPIMKYQPPCPCPPKAQECCPCPQQCCQQPCCQPACQPICFPGYPSCPYPMYCNPMCCNGKKKKKKDKKKSKKTKDSSSGGTTTETTTTSTNQTSTNTGSTNDNDDDDE